MADVKEEKALTEAQEVAPSAQPQTVDLSKYVPLEDFRKFQSTKDREVAEAKRIAEDSQKRQEAIEAQLEQLIADPAQRAAYQQERLKTQLEFYKQRDEMGKQRQWFHDNYGVPMEVLENAQTPAEATKLTLDWQREQKVQAAPVVKTEKEKEIERLEEEGGHTVSLSPGTPPERQLLSDSQIEKEIADLRVISQKGGSAGARARVEILKLEQQKQRGRAPRAKV